jgi:hypothetical protein
LLSAALLLVSVVAAAAAAAAFRVVTIDRGHVERSDRFLLLNRVALIPRNWKFEQGLTMCQKIFDMCRIFREVYSLS